MTGLMPIVALLVVLLFSIPTHWKERRERKKKLKIYAQNGGKPWVSPHPRISKNKEEWERQDEINRRARQIAGLE